MTRKKTTAASCVDKVAPNVIALPVTAKSMEAGGSQVSLTSKNDNPMVDYGPIVETSSVVKAAIAAPSSRSFSNNPAVIEAMRRKSARLNAEKIAAITDTQGLFSPVVAALTEPAPAPAILTDKAPTPPIILHHLPLNFQITSKLYTVISKQLSSH